MRSTLYACLLLATPALATEAATVAPATTAGAPIKASDLKARMVVLDKNGARVGPVIAVTAKADGTVDFVTVIQGENSARVSGSTLSMVDGKLTTSLARREIGR